MFGFVEKIFGSVKWIGKAISGTTDLIKRFTPSDQEQLGAAKKENAQLEDAIDAEERMEGESPSGERDTVSELRSDKY